MALIRDIIFKSRPSLDALLKEEIKKLNLKAVQKVIIRFDPFGEKVKEIRKFANLLYAESGTKSNPKCLLKTEILTDRSEQSITFDLVDGKQFIFKCTNLTQLEIFKLMNEHLTPLAPQEIEATKVDIKSAKTPKRK